MAMNDLMADVLVTDIPGYGQLSVLLAAVAAVAVSGLFAMLRLRKESDMLAVGSVISLLAGFLLAGVVLVWHASAGGGRGIPLNDNFSTLLWLGMLLALFVAYIQQQRAMAGLDAFVLPAVVLMLVAAAVFGKTTPDAYIAGTWSWVHRLTSYSGAVAFAVAAGSGVMYLLSVSRLRSKNLIARSGSDDRKLMTLERLERVSFSAVTLGFALLSVGMVTGVFRIATATDGTRLGSEWALSPKVLLAACVWLVYAVVLHAPMNPIFRGRRSAVLSVLGFVLMGGTIVAVQFMPTDKTPETANHERSSQSAMTSGSTEGAKP